MSEATIPPPVEGDSEDVHWALTTALSLQRRGEPHEALRWLKRAVSAAAESEQSARAVELGRRVAELELALIGAPTQQQGRSTAASSRTLEIASRPIPLDGLDEPTFVDSSHPPPGAEEVTLVPFTRKAGPDEPVWREDTKLSLGVAPRSSDTLKPPSTVRGEEDTLALRRAHDEDPDSNHPTSVDSMRVAVLSSADGEPRLMRLRAGVEAPQGAGVALLVPMSAQDAARIVNLLDQERRRR